MLWIAGCSVALSVVALACTGVGYGLATEALDREAAEHLRRLRVLQEREDVHHDARAGLEFLASRLWAHRSAEGEFPADLSERSPQDPWGTRLRYERLGPDRATLTSAGPDRMLGTEDDLVLELPER